MLRATREEAHELQDACHTAPLMALKTVVASPQPRHRLCSTEPCPLYPRKRTKVAAVKRRRGTARQWVLALSGRQGNVWLQDEKQIGDPHREYRDDQCSDDDLMSRHSEYGQARPQHAGNKAYNRYDPNHRCDGHQCIKAFFFPHAGSVGADPRARQLMPLYISV